MKKTLIFGAMALMASASLMAKDADQLRVYINPGHGSWTGNDRPCQLVGHNPYNVNDPDTTNFFESNTNLRKGYGVLEKLRQMGLKFDPTLNQTGELHQIGAARDLSNNIVMSHVKAGPYEGDFRTSSQLTSAKAAIYEKYSDGVKYDKLTAEQLAEIEGKFTDADKAEIEAINYAFSRLELFNRSLSEIDAEVDANNFDMFISIHSNANTEGSTSNYPLYLYRGYDEGKGGPKVENSDVMAKKCWPHSYANPHMVWTHYATSTNIRGDLNFYSTTSTYGYLGVLKHETPGFLVEGYFHTYQPARQRAMNWDVDYMEGYAYARGIADYFGLEDKTGSIYGVVRDLHEKFVHERYQPNAASDDLYLPLNGAKAVLKKGEETIAEYTTDDNYNGAYVFRDVAPGTYTIEISHPDYKAIDPIEVVVKAGETTYPASKMENTEYEPPKIAYVTYPDEFNLASHGPQGTYNFTDKFKDTPIEALEGKTIKRSIVRGETIYILALDAEGKATVVVFDVKNNKVLRELGTEGTKGEYLALSDIALTADGVLVGINKTLQPYGGSNNVHIYKWTNSAEDGAAEGNPEVWFSLNNGGNYSNGVTGETMAYAGTSEEGRLIYSAVTTAESAGLRFTNVTIVGSTMASAHHMNHNSNTNGNEVKLGKYQINISPASDDQFIINSSLLPAAEYICAKAAAGVPTPVASLGVEANTEAYKAQMFKYAGHSYMVVPVMQEVSTEAEGEEETAPQGVGVKLLDITEGLGKAKEVGAVGTTFAPAALEGLATMGQTIVTRDVEDNVTGGHMNLYVATANGVSHFTTEKVDQPVKRASFAYDLKSEGSSEEGYVVSFKVIEDAPMAKVILTNAETDEQSVYEAGEVKKGENSLELKDLGEGKYTWAVEVESEAQGVAGITFKQNASLANLTRGGVAVMSDEDSPSFGKVVVSNGYAQGIDLFSADLEHEGNYMKGQSPWIKGNGASSFRVGQNKGIAYLVDWSDAGAGYWMFDPMDPEKGVTNFLAGTKDNDGAYTYEGTAIGGGATGISFYGKGEDTKMYVWCEDYPSGNGNNLIRYNVGTKEIIDFAPELFGEDAHGKFANTNVNVQATKNGVLASQVRTSGKNSAGCPVFIFYNNDGEAVLNGGNMKEITSCSAGAAFNNDLSLFALAGNNTNISLWSVEWEGETPSLTYLYDVPGSNYKTEGVQLAWDNANNLYAYIRAEGLRVFTLRQDEPKALTHAPANYILDVTSGVDNVAVDVEEATGAVEFYNLHGVNVNSDNLVPGIYIRRQGKKAEKVVIR